MRQPNVLIIDDDAGSVGTFEPILKLHGFSVSVAADVESGTREIERRIPNVLILDLHLPTIDGVEFLRRLRSSSIASEVPVAIVTGDYFLDQRIPEEITQLGAKLFFKPLWEEDLVGLVRDLMRQPGPLRAPTEGASYSGSSGSHARVERYEKWLD
jgi:DNA-binding response OmpR family regulator